MHACKELFPFFCAPDVACSFFNALNTHPRYENTGLGVGQVVVEFRTTASMYICIYYYYYSYYLSYGNTGLGVGQEPMRFAWLHDISSAAAFLS